jgi:nicotinic acid mononucleotide adenylyltransferase
LPPISSHPPGGTKLGRGAVAQAPALPVPADSAAAAPIGSIDNIGSANHGNTLRPLTHTGHLTHTHTPTAQQPQPQLTHTHTRPAQQEDVSAQAQRNEPLLPKIDPTKPPPARGGSGKEPAAMEVYRGSTNAAGVPILELVRKMEYENIITRDDRLALNEALYNPSGADRREAVIQAVRNVELGMNPRFSVKRLKALIHGNAAGVPRHSHRSRTANESLSGSRKLQAAELAEALAAVYMTKNQNQTPRLSPRQQPAQQDSKQPPASSPSKKAKRSAKDPAPVAAELSVETQDTVNALNNVLGVAPTYADICSSSNVCAKIAANLRVYMARVKAKKSRPRPLVVIVGGGSFNPLTRMHLRTFFVAKQWIEKQLRAEVIGALLSPAHSSLVRLRYRTCASEVIPTAHRLAMAQLCVQDSRWISVDPWEVTRRCAMDYLSQLDHVQSMLHSRFPNVNIKLFYLSKPNFVPKLSIEGMKKNGFSCICVCRAPESDYLRSSLGSRSNGVVYIGEDIAILDTSMDQVSAKKVRDGLKAGRDVETLVGHAINAYISDHHIAQKVRDVSCKLMLMV